MSHIYKEYSQRILDIDANHKKIEGWLRARDSVYVYGAIHQQFASIHKLEKSINYYIRKNADKQRSIINIEELLLFHINYTKFFSIDNIGKLFQSEKDSKMYIDGLYRLQKKGYVKKINHKDEKGKSYYALTAEGKDAFLNIVTERELIPYTEYNYNNDGIAFHDCIVGSIYTRVLMLNIPFKYTRKLYDKEIVKTDDVRSDARIEILHSSKNMRLLYLEGDTGTEGIDILTAKIGNYYFTKRTTIDDNKYILFCYKEGKKGFYRDNFIGLFWGDRKQIENIHKLLKYYDCTLDDLINILERNVCLKDDINVSGDIDQPKYLEIIDDESENFIGYKIMKTLLCAKSVRVLLSCDWIDDKIVNINKESDCQRVWLICKYLQENKHSNGIEYYIDSKKNIEDTRKRRLSFVKEFVKNYNKIQDIWLMRDAISSIFSGIETLFVPACICQAYIPFFMKKESEEIYQKYIKDLLEQQYGHALEYVRLGAAFSTARNISDLFLRNCYYYIAEDNHQREIYVENISASLSAMIRVTTLVNELLGVSVEGRSCTIICMVDCLRDMQAFHKMLTQINKKYNNVTKFKLPIYYLMYDDIKGGKLRRYDME